MSKASRGFGGAIGSAVIVPNEPAVQRGCIINEQEFHILLEGAGGQRHSNMRDVSFGTAASSLIGLIGVLATADDPFSKGLKGAQLVFTIILGAMTLTFSVLAGLCIWWARAEEGRKSYVHCIRRVEETFRSDSLSVAEERPSLGSRDRPSP